MAEALVHEAVDDGVDAGRGVGQQVDVGDGRPGEAVGRAPVESLPRVDHEDGGPAQEEEEDDDQEHADHTLLGHQVGCGAAAAAHTLCFGLDAGAASTPSDALPFGLQHVTPVTVTRLYAASAGLSFCQGRDFVKKRPSVDFFISSLKVLMAQKVTKRSLIV